MYRAITPEVLDDRGNLSLHSEQGAKLAIEFFDEAGAALDMVNRTVFFIVDDTVEIELSPGDEAHILLLEIPTGGLNAYLNRVSPFVVIDKTDAIHELVWEGQVSVRGWN